MDPTFFFGAKWWFIKARGGGGEGTGPVGRKSCCPGCEGWLIIYYGVGGGKEKGRLRKYFHMLKKTQRILEACHCQVMVVYPSSKALT